MQSLINGIAQGSVFAISALGFSIISKTTKGLHLAHGAVMVTGGLVAISAASTLSTGAAFSLFFAVAVSAVVGTVIECCVYWPLARRAASRAALLLASLGAYLVMVGCLTIVFGQASIYPHPTTAVTRLVGVSISAMQQIQLSANLLVCLAAVLTLRYTNLGRLFRAQTDDPELLEVLGERPRHVRFAAAIIGSGLAGMAGGLVGLDVGMDVNYGLGASIGAAVAFILGGSGLSVMPGVAGLGIGILQAAVGSFTAEKWTSSVTYALLLVCLFRRSATLTRVLVEGQ